MNKQTKVPLHLITKLLSTGFLNLIIPCFVFASDVEQDDSSNLVQNSSKYPSAALAGRLQLRHDVFNGVYTHNSERETATYMPRGNVDLSGKLHKDLHFKISVEMDEKDDVVLETATLSYLFSEKKRIMIGHFKPDFGLEKGTSSSWITGIERSAIWDLAPDLNEEQDRDEYGLAGFYTQKHLHLSAATLHKSFGASVTMRAVVAPINHKDQVLHFGLSHLDNRVEPNAAGINSRLGVRGLNVHDNGNSSRLARDSKSTGFAGDRTTVVEFAYLFNNLSLQSEYLRRQLEGESLQEDRTASGHYVQIAYTLTGESRNYRLDGAKFDGITPKNKKWGAWEIFYRHDKLHVEGEIGLIKKNRSQSDASVNMVGVNWYVSPKLRLSTNYLEAKSQGIVNDTGIDTGKALSMQTQFLF